MRPNRFGIQMDLPTIMLFFVRSNNVPKKRSITVLGCTKTRVHWYTLHLGCKSVTYHGPVTLHPISAFIQIRSKEDLPPSSIDDLFQGSGRSAMTFLTVPTCPVITRTLANSGVFNHISAHFAVTVHGTIKYPCRYNLLSINIVLLIEGRPVGVFLKV